MVRFNVDELLAHLPPSRQPRQRQEATEFRTRVLEVVCQIPEGKVASYGTLIVTISGQVARVSGYPNHSRQVGNVLKTLSLTELQQVPWHRVVNFKGVLSHRVPMENVRLQAEKLTREGVQVLATGINENDLKVDLSVYQFQFLSEPWP